MVALISKDVMEWIHKVSFPFKSANFLGIGMYGYGLGLMKGLFLGTHIIRPSTDQSLSRSVYKLSNKICFDYIGQPYLMHPGHLAPYASYITLLPGQNDTNVGIFTDANGPGYASEFPPIVLHFLINQILMGKFEFSQKLFMINL